MTILAGWNMPGYMPDNEPADFETFEGARNYIAEELENVIESLYTGVLGDKTADEAEREAALTEEASLKEAIEYVRRQSGEFGFTVGKYHYFVNQS
jgi:hypothetical protein